MDRKSSDSHARTTPTERQVDRRNTLKALVAGGVLTGVQALPSRWSKPVVSSAVLPAHAGNSNVQMYECGTVPVFEAFFFEGSTGQFEIELGGSDLPTEAMDGTPFSSTIFLNGVEAEGVYSGQVNGGALLEANGSYDIEAEITNNITATNGSWVFDIGDDGNPDCTIPFTLVE